MKVDSETLAKIKRAFEAYKTEVYAAPLADTSKRSYTHYPDYFIRWLEDDFEPGIQNKRILRRLGYERNNDA